MGGSAQQGSGQLLKCAVEGGVWRWEINPAAPAVIERSTERDNEQITTIGFHGFHGASNGGILIFVIIKIIILIF
jgi:hypothetical protein